MVAAWIALELGLVVEQRAESGIGVVRLSDEPPHRRVAVRTSGD